MLLARFASPRNIAIVSMLAAVGAVLAFIFAWGRRSLNRNAVRAALLSTASTSAMIYVLIIGASLFGYFAAVTQAPQAMVEAVKASGIPVWGAVLVLMGVFSSCVMFPMKSFFISSNLFWRMITHRL